MFFTPLLSRRVLATVCVLAFFSPSPLTQSSSGPAGKAKSLPNSNCLATATMRADSFGINPESLLVSPPVLGGKLIATVDLSTTGHPFALLSCYSKSTEILLPGGQVLLGRHPYHQYVSAGPLARFEIPVPDDPALCGHTLTMQVKHYGGGLDTVLSNAQDLVCGTH